MEYSEAKRIIDQLRTEKLLPRFGDAEQVKALDIIERYCPTCKGSGETRGGYDECSKCDGTGRRKEN